MVDYIWHGENTHGSCSTILARIGGDELAKAYRWHRRSSHLTLFGPARPCRNRLVNPGQAGAIISGGKGTPAEKMLAMKKAGILVVENPAEIGVTMLKALSKKKTKTAVKKSNTKKKTSVKKS